MKNLVETIRSCVIPTPKPCVNISGGIDSTIILHHLSEKTTETIYTYTVGFEKEQTEFQYANQVADHYKTKHREILVENMLDEYPEILKHFSQPRFNLWPYWLAKAEHEDGRLNCYIGEGGDEHFGGYWYKPQKTYVEHWQGFFEYVVPTYKTIYDYWGLRLHIPLHPNNLSWQITYPYYDYTEEKKYLRMIYQNILPKFVIDRRKQNGRFSYFVIWENQLKPYFPNAHPKTEDDIRRLLNAWVIREWLKSHGATEIQTHKAMYLEC